MTILIDSTQEGLTAKDDWIVTDFDEAVLKESLPSDLSGEFSTTLMKVTNI